MLFSLTLEHLTIDSTPSWEVSQHNSASDQPEGDSFNRSTKVGGSVSSG